MIQSTAEREFAEIEDEESRFLIRYQIDATRFAQVISSVTPRSVLLLGLGFGDTGKCVLIGLISLPSPVDPSETVASFEGDYLVLRLAKSKNCASTSFAPFQRRIPPWA